MNPLMVLFHVGESASTMSKECCIARLSSWGDRLVKGGRI